MAMIRDIFKRKRDEKEATIPSKAAKDVPEGLMTKCPNCKHITLTKELENLGKVCPKCDHHFKMTAHERIVHLMDDSSFESVDDHLKSGNPLNFPGRQPSCGYRRWQIQCAGGNNRSSAHLGMANKPEKPCKNRYISHPGEPFDQG